MPALPSRARLLRVAVATAALLVAFFAGGWLAAPPPPAPATAEATASATTAYTCSMHPQVRQAEPGACPLCGMDLIPAGDDSAAAPTEIRLSPRARALARLRTTTVRRQSDSAAELRLLGRIEPAETTRRNVTTWVAGRIDRLHLNTTGERVRKGQVIATLYSPEVYSAHQDLLTARAQVARLGAGAPAALAAAEGALRAARERLRLLGVPEAELAEMAQAREPARAIAIRSPFSGTVIERSSTEGAYVDTGATLYRVADLRRLWVQLDAYESDLSQLAEGQPVELHVDALPGETITGRVAFVEPAVDPQRRTARVRVEVENTDGRLRPGMFAEAVVATSSAAETGAEAPLVVPATAPLFTGRRSLVYVETDGPRGPTYTPRSVRLGPRLGEVYPVVSGLSAGEVVVTRGAFVLDADLQIRGGPAMMQAPDDDAAAPALAPVPLAASERAALAPVLSAYLGIQTALADDALAPARQAATALQQAVAGVTFTGTAAAAWAPIAQALHTQATATATATDLEAARGAFEALSHATEQLLGRFGNPLDAPVQVAFCPMAKGNAGARWIQQGTTVDNAYFGAAMLTCGEIRATVAPGTHLDAIPAAPASADPHAGHDH